MNINEALELNVGDITYECEYGRTIAAEVVEKPVLEGQQVKWVGKDIKTGQLINYLLSKGYEHYIKLYKEPQYIYKRPDGKIYIDDGLEGIEL